MDKVYLKRYSEAFRRAVVAEYEAGASASSLQKRYGIGGKGTIPRWVRQYSNAGLRHEVVIIQRAEEQVAMAEREQELAERIRELEAAVAQLTLDKLMLETIVEVAGEKYGEDLKKKFGRRSSSRPTTKGKKGSR